jgi:Transposase DDE domain group 1
MNESITIGQQHFTPAASLAALGVKLEQMHLFEPIHRLVHIQQKTVKYTPTQKLYDGFIALLAGAHGLVEINTRLRADPVLQAAFGRRACAEQSVVQETLDHATQENVQQMEQAMNAIYRQHSQAYRHNYQDGWQILDIDMSGCPCGKKAAFATKGYFSQRNRRGRQLGRVLATVYNEVVVDRLFPGNQQLNATLQELAQAAQTTLGLTQEQRGRCLLRVDAGGGSVSNLNGLLEQGYHILGKACSGQQSRLLAKTVQEWMPDPHMPEREWGWVTEEPTAFVRPVRRLAVRCLKSNGTFGYGILICSLPDQAILALAGGDLEVGLALLQLYDQRGGGVETSFKGDKGGLGMTKRNKKRFEAQQLLMLLGSLAHNVIIWARGWLTEPIETTEASQTLVVQNPLSRYGILRMVRDVFHISGFLRFDEACHVTEIGLNQQAPLSRLIVLPLRHWLAPMNIVVNLGKT